MRSRLPRWLVTVLAAVLLIARAAGAQGGAAPEGHWAGAFMRAGASQGVEAEFTRGDSLRVVLAIPERFLSVPWRGTVQRDPRGFYRFPTPYGSATLALDTAFQEMVGGVGPDSLGIRLHLKRIPAPLPPRFSAHEVSFRSGAVELKGRLLRPLGIHRPAVAVMVHGRGCAPRGPDAWRGDEYYRWAEALAPWGIAVLVYDQRGSGRSGGADCDSATVEDFTRDVAAAVAYARSRADVDPARVGLIGHSAGGWVAARASGRTRPAFLVMLAGPATSVREQQLGGMRAILRARHLSGADSADAIRYVETMFASTPRPERYRELVRLAGEGRRTGWYDDFISPGDYPRDEGEADRLWVRLNAYDPEADLRRFRGPLLALYGGADGVVPAADNAPLLRRLVSEAGNTRARVLVVPEMGHGLQQRGRMREAGGVAYWKFPRVAPDAWDALVGFLMDNGMLGDAATPAVRRGVVRPR